MTKEDLARFCFKTYGVMLQAVGSIKRIRPSVLAGVMMRESECGLSPLLKPSGPEGIGDGGHGYGLFQLDIRWHKQFIDSELWRVPFEACCYACNILNSNLMEIRLVSAKKDLPQFDLERAAIAAYNCGCAAVLKEVSAPGFELRDPDAATTGRNYSADVLLNAQIYRSIKSQV